MFIVLSSGVILTKQGISNKPTAYDIFQQITSSYIKHFFQVKNIFTKFQSYDLGSQVLGKKVCSLIHQRFVQ